MTSTLVKSMYVPFLLLISKSSILTPSILLYVLFITILTQIVKGTALISGLFLPYASTNDSKISFKLNSAHAIDVSDTP